VIGRKPFRDLVARQLDLFEREHADLIRACDEAERAYDRAPRDEAEERYAVYDDLVDDGTEILANLRDAYAATLDEDTAARYEDAFHRAVGKRFPRFAPALPNT
jgi:sugar-specific transcriptional regulator TrmB